MADIENAEVLTSKIDESVVRVADGDDAVGLGVGDGLPYEWTQAGERTGPGHVRAPIVDWPWERGQGRGAEPAEPRHRARRRPVLEAVGILKPTMVMKSCRALTRARQT